MLRILQILHLLWLALAPVLFALFRLFSEPHDADRAFVDNLFVLCGAGWVGCVAIFFVVTGKQEGALPGLLRVYRGLLWKVWFLWIANVTGGVLVLVLAYQLTFFRQVEFRSTTDVELILNDRVGDEVPVGLVRARTPSNFRLHIGSRKLVFRELGSGKILDYTILQVPSLIHGPAKIRTTINQKGTTFERTR